MSNVKKIIAWVSLFALAMGYLESAVVIYLRELYYPSGFKFPLQPIPPLIAKVEFMREAATLVMLAGIGIIAGNTRLQRFAYFTLAFGIWDLFYYVFLWVCLGWPESLYTWDILFLIPVPWVGPVWAPCLLALLMCGGAVLVIVRSVKNPFYRIKRREWTMMFGGAAICIVSFMLDYFAVVASGSDKWSVFSASHLFSELQSYVPRQFNTPLFAGGFALMCLSIVLNLFNQNITNYENQ